MGGISFKPQTLGDSLSETAGYKSGLALSIEEMCDHLSDTSYADIISSSETSWVRIRSEEYYDIFYKLLHRIGYTEEEYNGGLYSFSSMQRKHNEESQKILFGVIQVITDRWEVAVQETIEKKAKSIDPTNIIDAVFQKYGSVGVDIASDYFERLNQNLALNPGSNYRYTEWQNIEPLETLFSGSTKEPEIGKFIDQRFINYLSVNHEKLKNMHWRKFEELTAEYFSRDGFKVELGPGSNDDGVDVRVWNKDQNHIEESPHIVIQCKRQKRKIEKVVIKGLYADMKFYEADYGLIVTTSELSPGAKETISIRGYSIQEVNNFGLRQWLTTLQKPGTGIVRV